MYPNPMNSRSRCPTGLSASRNRSLCRSRRLPKSGSWRCFRRCTMNTETLDFLEALFAPCEQGFLTFTAIHPDGQHPTPSRHVPVNDRACLTRTLDRLMAANEQGWGAYVAVATRKANLGRWRRGRAGRPARAACVVRRHRPATGCCLTRASRFSSGSVLRHRFRQGHPRVLDALQPDPGHTPGGTCLTWIGSRFTR